MRLTTGIYKNRKIIMPKGIRPTQEKVRKAIFDILQDIEGLSFLELFAGSGAVGIEALSRGASFVVLVENNRSCLISIKRNLEMLKIENCSVISLSTEPAIVKLYNNKEKFDIIFLDPPYNQELAKKTLQLISAYDILAANGLLILQHSRKENLPETQGGLILFKRSKYGDTVLSFYKKETEVLP